MFDIGNRLSSAPGTAGYAYDGHGRRNLVWFASGDYMHQAYTQDGKLRFAWRLSQGGRRHVYLGDKLIAERDQSGATTFMHTDALGSPVATTNGSGQVGTRTGYEPYGRADSGTVPSRIGFTGHVNDPDTGLVYMQQRYMDPVAGRFLSDDPVTTNLMNAGSFNRYKYASNNPYKYIDPDGRVDCTASPSGGFTCKGSVTGTRIPQTTSIAATGLGTPTTVASMARSIQGALASPVGVGIGLALTPSNSGQVVKDQLYGPHAGTGMMTEGSSRGLPPEGVSPPVDGEVKPGPASRPSEQGKGGQSLWMLTGASGVGFLVTGGITHIGITIHMTGQALLGPMSTMAEFLRLSPYRISGSNLECICLRSQSRLFLSSKASKLSLLQWINKA